MTVFSKDFTKVEPAEILNAKAVMTIVDGKVVYS
jgi:predicted amidohydrolase YtcJ